MTDTAALLPCPFCGRLMGGGPTLIHPTRADGTKVWGVRCNEDFGGCGAYIMPRHKTRTLAEAEWNRRSAPAGAARGGDALRTITESDIANVIYEEARRYERGQLALDPTALRPELAAAIRIRELFATQVAAVTPAGMPPQEWVDEFDRRLQAHADAVSNSALSSGRDVEAALNQEAESTNALRAHVLSRVAEPDDVAELRKAAQTVLDSRGIHGADAIMGLRDAVERYHAVEKLRTALSSTADAATGGHSGE